MSARAGTLALSVALGACASTVPIRGSDTLYRTRAAGDAPAEVFGRIVHVQAHGEELRGELLACDGAQLYLRLATVDGEAWERVAWRDALEVSALGPSGGGAMLGWSIAGLVSTITHGFFLVISAPVWLLSGSIVTALNWSPTTRLANCSEAAPYARFPQGLPESMRERASGSPRPDGTPTAPGAPPAAAPVAPWMQQ
ncbi:MAG: hypothetical protein HY909_01790 [Deltaproteobacteria bacterium]|nr:hypothetical protein [Deltaproteobacteria bacterium]